MRITLQNIGPLRTSTLLERLEAGKSSLIQSFRNAGYRGNFGHIVTFSDGVNQYGVYLQYPQPLENKKQSKQQSKQGVGDEEDDQAKKEVPSKFDFSPGVFITESKPMTFAEWKQSVNRWEKIGFPTADVYRDGECFQWISSSRVPIVADENLDFDYSGQWTDLDRDSNINNWLLWLKGELDPSTLKFVGLRKHGFGRGWYPLVGNLAPDEEEMKPTPNVLSHKDNFLGRLETHVLAFFKAVTGYI